MSYSSYSDYLKYKNCKRDTVPCHNNYDSYSKYTRSLACCRAWWTNDDARKLNAITPCNMIISKPITDCCPFNINDMNSIEITNVTELNNMKSNTNYYIREKIDALQNVIIPLHSILYILQGGILNLNGNTQSFSLTINGTLYNSGIIDLNQPKIVTLEGDTSIALIVNGTCTNCGMINFEQDLDDTLNPPRPIAVIGGWGLIINKGGIFNNKGIIDFKGDVFIAGGVVNEGTFYNYCEAIIDFKGDVNEASGVYNEGTFYNYKGAIIHFENIIDGAGLCAGPDSDCNSENKIINYGIICTINNVENLNCDAVKEEEDGYCGSC